MPRDARSEDSRKLGIAVELYATQMSIVPRAQKLARLSINAPTVKTRLSVRQVRDAMSCHHNRTAPASALLRPMLRVSIRKSNSCGIRTQGFTAEYRHWFLKCRIDTEICWDCMWYTVRHRTAMRVLVSGQGPSAAEGTWRTSIRCEANQISQHGI